MDPKDFSTWILILVSFSSSILIGNIWRTFFYYHRDSNESNNSQKLDYGLLYLALALFIWGLSGIATELLLSSNEATIEVISIKIIFSSLNSLLLLLGSSHLEFSPRWIVSNRKKANTIYILCSALVIFFTIILKKYSSNPYYLTLPDFLLSVPTVLLLGYTLSVTFWRRELVVISIFSVITLLLLLKDQPALSYNSSNYSNTIIGLFSRLSFIIIICLLAFSWAQTNLKTASSKLITLSDQVTTLQEKIETSEEEVKIVKEIAQKDERDSVWQDVAMKAAHKIGNPIEAIDTANQRAIRKLNGQDHKGARLILNEMDESIEEAKKVLEEFKSYTKLYEKKSLYCDIVKIIRQSSRSISEEDNVEINIDVINKKLIPDVINKTNDSISLSTMKLDETVDVNIDREKIKHCFDEFIANSLHFFEKEKENKFIDIAVEYVNQSLPPSLPKERDYIRIIYSDNGIGIPEKDKINVFNPFVTTHQHGNGLGLAIVKRIIDLHEGVIFENGEEGKGVRFEVYLPIDTSIKK